MAEHIPPTDNDAPYLSIQNVVKRFGDHAAVNNVSIDIGKGEIFALLGSSGCGKSTLLRMLAGFELPTSGKILLKGEDISKIPPYERPINMMFQSYALFPHLNVWDNIAFGLRREKIAKAEIPQRVDDVLKLTQLTKFAKRKPHQLSGGQQQRIQQLGCVGYVHFQQETGVRQVSGQLRFCGHIISDRVHLLVVSVYGFCYAFRGRFRGKRINVSRTL